MTTKSEIIGEFASKNGVCPRSVREIVEGMSEDDGGIYDMSSMLLASGKRYMRREEVLETIALDLQQLIRDIQATERMTAGMLAEYDGGFDLESI